VPLEVRTEANVLAQLVAWAEAEPRVRALILTSTRAQPGRASDLLSDYDVIVTVADADAFAADGAWLSAYGQPLVRWRDEDELYRFATRTA
jgi:aminoglycoside 6-adenylyltransferase